MDDVIAPLKTPKTHTHSVRVARRITEPDTSRVSAVKHPIWRKIGLSVFLLFCIAGALAISKYMLIHDSLQLDEAQSLWQTSHSIGGTLHVVALDVHVPLYHLILHFWQLYFGQGIVTARVLSLIFFALTIPVFYLLAREILSTRYALLATFLFSFSPFMNWYANVARMYTLLALFATISQLLFLRLMRKRKAWTLFGATSIIGAYSHYFFSFNLAVEGMFFLINRKYFVKHSLRRFITIGLLVAAALAPWLYYFHRLGSASTTRPILARPSTVDFFNAYSQFLFGFQNNHINTVLVSCWPIVMLLGFLAVRRNQRLTPAVGFIASMAFVPVALAFALSYLVTPFFLSRYLISSVAPLIIFLVWMISYYGKRLTACVSLVLVGVLVATSLQQAYSASTPVKEDYRDAANYINVHAEPQDLVVLSSPFTIYPFEYYYRGSSAIVTLPEWDRSGTSGIPAFNVKTMPTQIQTSSANHQDVYLLLSYNQGYENKIKQYYLDHYKELYVNTYSNDLTLYVFKVGYTTLPKLGEKGTIIAAAPVVKPVAPKVYK
jgi:mannosyltransferase